MDKPLLMQIRQARVEILKRGKKPGAIFIGARLMCAILNECDRGEFDFNTFSLMDMPIHDYREDIDGFQIKEADIAGKLA